MKLIIGKNSKIVNAIRNRLDKADFLSHSELDGVDFDKYTEVFVFSWSHSNQLQNIDLISRIPPKKIVFVSTTAVYSLLIRKQWAPYPNNKNECEHMALNGGGSVIRIGVWDQTLVEKIYGMYQYTSEMMLIDALNRWKSNGSKIINCYEYKHGEMSARKARVGILLRSISQWLPSNKIFQAPFVAIGRVLNIANYGYTGDTIACCQRTMLVGYGAFGGVLYKRFRQVIDMVICSPDDNISLNFSGFRNTMIGKSIYGLSSAWHGVYIAHKNGLLQKKILASRTNKRVEIEKIIECNVEKISYENGLFRCQVSLKSSNTHSYYGYARLVKANQFEICCERLLLAAGPLENARLINTLEPIEIEFDDHEQAILGEIDLEEISGHYIKKFGFLAQNKQIECLAVGNTEVLVDFRPYVSTKKSDSLAFYSSNSSSIVYKLITQLNKQRLNEAFYNRYKICIKTAKFQVYGQYLAKGCITYEEGKLKRVRVTPSEWELVQKTLLERFKTYKPYPVKDTIDGLHTWSSTSFEKTTLIKKLLSNGTLKIFGSPNPEIMLTSKHHTQDFRMKMLADVDLPELPKI